MSYECVDCSRLFNTDRGILAHCRAKGHVYYQCDLCDDGDIFKDGDELAEHMENFHEECEKCNTVLVDYETLHQHYRYCFAPGDAYCQQCNRNFRDESARQQHYQNSAAHCDNYCRQCERIFQDESAREQHYKNSAVHRDSYCFECERLFDDDDEKDWHDETYCHQCERQFQNESAKDQHVQNSQAHQIYYGCDMCNKTFKDESSLNQHLRDSFAHKQVIINNTFCPICEKRFNNPEDLQRHNSSPVHRDRNTPCVFTGCSSKFKTPSGLAQHVESSCERSPLSRHQITAAVQSLNIAPKFSLRSVEGSSFMPGTSRPLIGYQPLESSFNGHGYQCPICSKTFRSLPSLEAHLNSAAHDEDEFKCPKCNTHFTLISGLVQHLESVSCGLSNITDVERRFAKMTEQFSRSLKF